MRENCNIAYKQCNDWEDSKELNWGKTLKDTTSIIMGLTMANIFSLVAIFVFAAFVIFLIVRILVIWFLLIIAPAAWLFSILPNTQHLFKQWWNAFLKWCFFAPIYMFFVYIALASFRNLLTGEMVANTATNVEPSEFLPALFEWSNMLNFVLAIGMLVGGLIVAQKMSIVGAKGAMGIAKGFRKGAAGAGARLSGINALKRYRKASKAAKEGIAKEKLKRRIEVQRVGGAKQWVRERLRPTARGRAEARTEKTKVVDAEAKRIGESMNRHEVRKQAGKRGLTGRRRVRKLAAMKILSEPDTKSYKEIKTNIDRRTKPLPVSPMPGLSPKARPTSSQRKYNKIRRLESKIATEINKAKIQKRLQKYQ